MSNTPHVDEIARRLGVELPAITKARRAAMDRRDSLVEHLGSINSSDTSIVAFGSLARLEWTCGSDVDWTLLVDGIVDPNHFAVVRKIQDGLLELKEKPPGRENVFGNMAISHVIVHHIGGEEDTNRNITQRILLLLESYALGHDAAHERVLRSILDRYVVEDRGLLYGKGADRLPRFLLNDIIRYWRTIAVDYAYKQRERAGKGLPLRNLKFRMSRKLTFAAGLLMCFLCNTEEIRSAADNERATKVRERLLGFTRHTPLDIFCEGLSEYEIDHDLARRLLQLYEDFIGILSDAGKRAALEELSVDRLDDDTVADEARKIARDFDSSLRKMFFGSSSLGEMTTKFGVF